MPNLVAALEKEPYQNFERTRDFIEGMFGLSDTEAAHVLGWSPGLRQTVKTLLTVR